MRKLFSILVLVFIILAAAWAAASYWYGKRIEEGYKACLARISESGPMKLTLDSYDRGIWTSKATVTSEFVLPGDKLFDKTMPLRFSLTQEIFHGPIPLAKGPGNEWQVKPVVAVANSNVSLAQDSGSWARELLVSLPEINETKLVAVVYTTGDAEVEFITPAIDRTLPGGDNLHVRSDVLRGFFKFGAGMKRITASLSLPVFEVENSKTLLRIQGITSATDTRQGIGGLYFGDFSFNLPTLEVRENTGDQATNLRASDFRVEVSTRESGIDLADGSLTAGIAGVSFDGRSFGPVRFNIQWRRFDVESLVKLKSELADMERQMPDLSREDYDAMMTSIGLNLLGGLIKKSPEIEITELKLSTPDGEFSGKAKLGFNGPKGPKSENPLLLLGALTAQCELLGSEALVRGFVRDSLKRESDSAGSGSIEDGTTRQLEQLTAQNLLVKDGDTYKASASYQGGKVVLNGRAIPLSHLLR